MENDFSNIPEEAANKLIGAGFNTSNFYYFFFVKIKLNYFFFLVRESQSQSSVLFNWLLGKSNQGPNS